MAIKYGQDWEWAREKLMTSFLTMGPDIIHVNDVNPECEVEYTNIYTGRHWHCLLDDIETEPPLLGYVNQNRLARFVTRTPARHWRQGFRQQTIRAYQAVRSRVPRLNIDSSFVLCHRNIYPNVETAIERVCNDEDVSVAFSRQFAIFKKKTNMYVEYKGHEVGNVNEDNGTISLNNQFIFLQEVLGKCK